VRREDDSWDEDDGGDEMKQMRGKTENVDWRDAAVIGESGKAWWLDCGEWNTLERVTERGKSHGL
jgi:hypothetical protein